MRAIIATWKNTLPELPEEVVWPVIQKLSDIPPHYDLPDASVSHTRHYMPTNKKNTLVIDTFVVVRDKPVRFIWDGIKLDSEEKGVIDTLLKNLHYFGRAESWCVADASTDTYAPNCSPLGGNDFFEDSELVLTLAPKPGTKFVDINRPVTGSGTDEINSMSVTTGTLHGSNYADPPGARWVQYARPQNCFEGKTSGDTMTSHMSNVTLVRFAVVGDTRPLIRDTLRIGDLARTACMSKYGKANHKETSHIFSGKDPQGRPLAGHRHALYLPTYETQNREIDHLTIIAAGGFDKRELDVLFSLNRLYRRDLAYAGLIFQGCGAPKDFPDIPILKKSRIWVAATPVILTRHTKYRGSGSGRRVIDGPEEQVRNEIKKRYGPQYDLKDIVMDDSHAGIHNTNVKPFEFFRWRNHGSVGDGRAYSVRLEFKAPVAGPITLGYGSHYGLGMFVPEETRK